MGSHRLPHPGTAFSKGTPPPQPSPPHTWLDSHRLCSMPVQPPSRLGQSDQPMLWSGLALACGGNSGRIGYMVSAPVSSRLAVYTSPLVPGADSPPSHPLSALAQGSSLLPCCFLCLICDSFPARCHVPAHWLNGSALPGV